MATIHTVGHGARTGAELISILKQAGIDVLVGISRSGGWARGAS